MGDNCDFETAGTYSSDSKANSVYRYRAFVADVSFPLRFKIKSKTIRLVVLKFYALYGRCSIDMSLNDVPTKSAGGLERAFKVYRIPFI